VLAAAEADLQPDRPPAEEGRQVQGRAFNQSM